MMDFGELKRRPQDRMDAETIHARFGLKEE
jgi:hypothetical protein